MSTLLSAVGAAAFIVGAVGVVGVVKGGVQHVGLAGRKQSAWAVAGASVVVAAGAAMAPTAPVSGPTAAEKSSAGVPTPTRRAPDVVASATPAPAAEEKASSLAATATPAPASPRSVAATPLGPLLLMAAGGDGDSWHDTHGVEYRMGLVNTPEVNECGGSAGTAYRKRALSAGFYARSYTTDTYHRRVAVIYTRSGVNLNVAMAREGIANDKYLAAFRQESPQFARQLDAAFALAKSSRAGVWGSCSPGGSAVSSHRSSRPQGLAGSGGGCHPDYRTCLPVKGDGSGQGNANDLDCGDIRKVVHVRAVGRDPYRLDADGDGVGCESYG